MGGKMKTLTIECATCGIGVEKPKKEIVRQRKKGRTEFYCSQTCSGKASRVFDTWRHSEENKEHCRKISPTRSDEYTGFREYMRRVRKRNHKADIDLPYLKEIWEAQNGKCAYTKVQLEHPTASKSSRNYNFMSSLDRIDSSKGYVKGNVQYVSVSVNWLKNQMDDNHLTEFFQIVSGVN